MDNPPEDMEHLLLESSGVEDPHKGDLLEGRIIHTDAQGYIVDLGLKRDGVIPREDLDNLDDQSPPLNVGDTAAVMVINPVDSDGNLIVSISQARESGDWLKAQNYLENDTIFEAQSSDCNRGGLIIPFGRLRGFLPASHVSQLSRGISEQERDQQLNQLVGNKFPLKVIEVDPQRRRLVLSERKAIRQWRQEQKAKIIKSLKVGEVRKGVVTSLREFGAFVDIGGADGLIHISELAWRRVESPGDVLQIGDEIDTLIIKLDQDSNRIGLSIKRLQPNPWETAAEKVEIGAIYPGVVTQKTSSGAYVRVLEDLEGLIRPEEFPHQLVIGENLQVQVESLDPEHERLELVPITDSDEDEISQGVTEHAQMEER
jgi:small subunit ribosomal protein S1